MTSSSAITCVGAPGNPWHGRQRNFSQGFCILSIPSCGATYILGAQKQFLGAQNREEGRHEAAEDEGAGDNQPRLALPQEARQAAALALAAAARRGAAAAGDLGFGRTVVPELEAPRVLVNLV